jgi:hypothetical protein
VSTLGPESAQSAVAAVHGWLVRRAQLYRSLAMLLEAAIPAPAEADNKAKSSHAVGQTLPPGTPPSQQTVPAAEALITILTSRSVTGDLAAVCFQAWQPDTAC